MFLHRFVSLALATLLLFSLTAQRTSPAPEGTWELMSQLSEKFGDGTAASAIKLTLDQSFKKFEIESTVEQYAKAADILTAAKQKSGIPEMPILRHMIRTFKPANKTTFEEAAAISAQALVDYRKAEDAKPKYDWTQQFRKTE